MAKHKRMKQKQYEIKGAKIGKGSEKNDSIGCRKKGLEPPGHANNASSLGTIRIDILISRTGRPPAPRFLRVYTPRLPTIAGPDRMRPRTRVHRKPHWRRRRRPWYWPLNKQCPLALSLAQKREIREKKKKKKFRRWVWSIEFRTEIRFTSFQGCFSLPRAYMPDTRHEKKFFFSLTMMRFLVFRNGWTGL